jgi:hypothetical protein
MKVHQQTFSVPFQAYLPRFHVFVVRVKAVILVTVYFTNIGSLFENVEHWAFKPLQTFILLFVELITVVDLIWKGIVC